MPTQASAAYGTQIRMGTAPGTLIPEVTNISDVGAQFATVDVSAHDGVSSFGSKIPTLLDGGTVRVTANFVPANAQHVALRTNMLNRTSVPFTVQWPTTGNPTVTFNAFVTRYRIPAAPVNGALQLEVELSVDGAVSFS